LYIWAAQQTRGVIHLAVSFSCWFSVIRVPLFVFLSCFSLSGMLNDQEDCGSRVFVSAEVAEWETRYLNGQSTYALGGLFWACAWDLLQLPKYPDFWRI